MAEGETEDLSGVVGGAVGVGDSNGIVGVEGRDGTVGVDSAVTGTDKSTEGALVDVGAVGSAAMRLKIVMKSR